MYKEARGPETPADRVQELEQAMRELYGSALQSADPAWAEVVGGGGSSERIFVARSSDTTRPENRASSYTTDRQPRPSSAQRNASLDSSSSATGSRSQSTNLISLLPSGTSMMSGKSDGISICRPRLPATGKRKGTLRPPGSDGGPQREGETARPPGAMPISRRRPAETRLCAAKAIFLKIREFCARGYIVGARRKIKRPCGDETRARP